MDLAPLFPSWRWPYSPNGHFSTKSLLADMGDLTNLLKTSLAEGIWKDKYPKNKILWELHIELSIQKNFYMFFHCSFARKFWNRICAAFGWSLVFTEDVKDLLNIVLLGHPFKNAKAIL